MMKDYFNTFLQYLIPKRLVTELAGKLADSRIPFVKNHFIRLFVKIYKVNMQEALRENPEDYLHFNDFFIRQLKPQLRPIAEAKIVSPVDGNISEIGPIAKGQIIQAKGHSYSVAALLASDADIANQFTHGSFATLYLAPKDYHRIHMPIEAKLLKTIYIPGSLYSVQPATARIIPNLFAKNERLVVFFETNLGKMVMVLVGATIVGAIGTSWAGDIKRGKKMVTQNYELENIVLTKGSEMGYFKLGSTVILLFANDRESIQWLPHLKAGVETKFGAAVGESIKKPHP